MHLLKKVVKGCLFWYITFNNIVKLLITMYIKTKILVCYLSKTILVAVFDIFFNNLLINICFLE